MKTIKILIVTSTFFLLLMNVQSFAGSNPTNEEGKVKRVVSSAVDYPKDSEVCFEGIATVAVDFRVNENGKIVVNEINGSPDLVSYVKEKLEKVVIKKVSKLTEKSFVYKFIFSK
ncbi:MAG: hypothetical protein HY951_09805 [Bacteroidia bacterium]|nr:hypothetical protein [Bacteroidia bacterium]